MGTVVVMVNASAILLVSAVNFRFKSETKFSFFFLSYFSANITQQLHLTAISSQGACQEASELLPKTRNAAKGDIGETKLLSTATLFLFLHFFPLFYVCSSLHIILVGKNNKFSLKTGERKLSH